jgi:hypothetical protein
MISIGKTIVSKDVVTRHFICDLPRCHGECCVQGDSGAPLEEDEIGIIEDSLDEILPFMTSAGKAVVNKNGVFDYDSDGDFVTPLVKDHECAFVYFENNLALCAIEKAYREGKIKFLKPVSCHLYPIRITKYSDFEAVNYHQWNICDVALLKGKMENKTIYEFLKVPLIRKYGDAWFKQLDDEVKSGKYDDYLLS